MNHFRQQGEHMSNVFRIIILLATMCIASTTATADVFFDSYQRGLKAYKAREYASARAEFLRAYDLRPEPIILFNIAQTYRLELNSEEALAYYKRFLAESKIAEALRKEAQSYVASLEAELAERASENKLYPVVRPTDRDGTPVAVPIPPMDRPPPTSPRLPSDAAPSTRADAVTGAPGGVWSTKRKIAVGTATTGVLALAAGAILGSSARSRENDAHALCGDPQLTCDASAHANDLLRSGHNLAIDANIAFGAAAVATIAAGVLWFTGAPESHPRVAVVPAASSGQVILTATGSF